MVFWCVVGDRGLMFSSIYHETVPFCRNRAMRRPELRERKTATDAKVRTAAKEPDSLRIQKRLRRLDTFDRRRLTQETARANRSSTSHSKLLIALIDHVGPPSQAFLRQLLFCVCRCFALRQSVPRHAQNYISGDIIMCAFGVPGYMSHGPLPGAVGRPVVAVVALGM